MTIKYKEPCNVSGDDCECPAGWGISGYGYYEENYKHGKGAKFVCFCCGLPVCRKCSKIIKEYFNFGKQRICIGCLGELRDDN